MNRPSFQFYPGDWQGNSNLRRCTFAEKGVWLEILCLLHDQEEYGVVRWPLKEIIEATKAPAALVKSLVAKGVLKGADRGLPSEEYSYIPRSGRKDGPKVVLIPQQDGPIWYSSRMVRDEYIATRRGHSTYEGRTEAQINDAPKPSPNTAPNTAPKDTPNHSPKGGISEGKGDGLGEHQRPHPSRAAPSSSSSPSRKEDNNQPPITADPRGGGKYEPDPDALAVRVEFLRLLQTHWPDHPDTAIAPWMAIDADAALYLRLGASVEKLGEWMAEIMAREEAKGRRPPGSLRAYSRSIEDRLEKYLRQFGHGATSALEAHRSGGVAAPSGDPEPTPERDEHIRWRVRYRLWLNGDGWDADCGPDPDQPDCRLPQAVRDEVDAERRAA